MRERSSSWQMQPSQTFFHCPRCGKATRPSLVMRFVCQTCGFVYFFNPTVAAAAIILNPSGSLLLIERAKEPAKGKWAFVGGFIDPGESAEEGLQREIREEVGLLVHDIRYLCCYPNAYHYLGITYPVLDFFYTARSMAPALKLDPAEVTSHQWLDPEEVKEEDLAFSSMQRAFQKWKST